MTSFKKHKDEFPSASLLLDISRNEYERERERANMLDNKSSFFISATIAITTIYIPLIPFHKLIEDFDVFEKKQLILITIFICFVVIALVFLILAIYNLYKSYALKIYKNVNIENLNDSEILSTEQNQVEKALVEHYNTILIHNFEVNNSKAEKISLGLKYCILSFAFLCIPTVCLIAIIGG